MNGGGGMMNGVMNGGASVGAGVMNGGGAVMNGGVSVGAGVMNGDEPGAAAGGKKDDKVQRESKTDHSPANFSSLYPEHA